VPFMAYMYMYSLALTVIHTILPGQDGTLLFIASLLAWRLRLGEGGAGRGGGGGAAPAYLDGTRGTTRMKVLYLRGDRRYYASSQPCLPAAPHRHPLPSTFIPASGSRLPSLMVMPCRSPSRTHLPFSAIYGTAGTWARGGAAARAGG